MKDRRLRLMGSLALAVLLNGSAGPVHGQCTDPAPVNLCAPGCNGAETECQLEWLFDAMPKKLRNGVGWPDLRGNLPNSRIFCVDGDPRCDFDGDPTNHSCTFETAVCINNSDPRLPACSPTDISKVWVMEPRQSSVFAPPVGNDAANQAELEDLFANFFGVTVVRREHLTSLETVVSAGAPNATLDLCSPRIQFTVDQFQNSLGTWKEGRRQIRVMAVASAQGVLSGRARETDRLRLICVPSKCGDGIVQRMREQCDDGNLINGDGCDQGCQIE